MYIFIIVFIALLILAILDQFVNTNIFIYISMLILVILAGFRNIAATINNDTSMYYGIYNGYIDRKLEGGYVFLENIFHLLNANWTCFAIFIALLTLGIVTKEFSVFTDVPGYALLYYYARFFVSRDMNQIRASLATAILFLAVKYVYDNKLLNFLLVIFIAWTIHHGALVGILIYPLYEWLKNIKKQKYLGIFATTIVIAIGLSFTMNTFFVKISDFFTSVYITNPSFNQGGGLLNPVLWLQILISFIAVYSYDQNKYKKTKYYSVILVMYVLSTVLLALFNQYYTLAGRISTILATGEPIIIINLLESWVKGPKKYICFVIFTIIIFYLINNNLVNSDLINIYS